MGADAKEKKEFFYDKPENIKKIKIGAYSTAALLVFIDFFVHRDPHHLVIDAEKMTGFYSIYGLVACVLIIVISKSIGKYLLLKKEDYYD